MSMFIRIGILLLCHISSAASRETVVRCKGLDCRPEHSLSGSNKTREGGSRAITAPVKYNNINRVGVGYDIFQGNPHVTGGKFDPGYKLNPVFTLTYDQQRKSTDGRHLLPDNSHATDLHHCSFDVSVDVIHDSAAYRKSLDEDVSLYVGAFGARFSSSVDYRSVTANTETHGSQYYSASAECLCYQAQIEPMLTNISDLFVMYVSKLPVEISTESNVWYRQFIETFGTHYVRQVTMGGRYGYRSTLTTDSVISLRSSGLDIEVMAKYSGMFSMSASSRTSINATLVKKFDETRTHYTIYTSGGGPPPPGGLANATEWYNFVLEEPNPVSYQLGPLSSLLTEDHFPRDENIALKKNLLEKAITLYCNSLNLLYCTLQPPGPLPQVANHIVTDYVQIWPGFEFFWTPLLSDPNYRVMGTLFSVNGQPPTMSDQNKTETLVLDQRFAPTEIVREAIGWEVVRYNDHLRSAFLRAKCPNNFTSLSDFVVPCSYCTRYYQWPQELPPNLPCISTRCVTQCSWKDSHYQESNILIDVLPVTNGHPEFGDNGNYSRVSFFRAYFADIHLFQCLTTTCLQGY